MQRTFVLAVLTSLLAACAPAATPPVTAPAEVPARAAFVEPVALHERYQVGAIEHRRFTYDELWSAIEPLIDGAADLEREEIGRSAEGRPLYLVRYGEGPTRVLLWSQMHGDESTATMALADLFRFLAEAPEDPRARLLTERLTVLAIPMLNPDGAERFQRRNAQGIDINRDAHALVTPEAQALKAAHERYRPAFGFNLHDQNVRIRVGESDRTAAISLLAPPFNQARSYNAVRERARQVAAVLRQAAEPQVGGHIARYDDTFNPRAFGDLMQSWGTSTVLLESGGWRDDPQKQYLRRVNFVILLAALEAIATGAYVAADPLAYETLPPNGPLANDLLVRGGTLVVPGLPPARADLVINYEDPLERRGGRIVDVGELTHSAARDTLDVSDLFLHPAPEVLRPGRGGGRLLQAGAPASFVVRRGPETGSGVVWLVEEGVARSAGTPQEENRGQL